jgi:lipoyl(octanoyl) transferase
MSREGLLLDLGAMSYAAAWKLQLELRQSRVDGRIPDTLILVEHPHVITLGKSGRIENLRVSEAELKRRGVELFRVERGGDITYHGPGQLVGYPIFLLKDALAGVRRFVDRVEESLIHALSVWGIQAAKSPVPQSLDLPATADRRSPIASRIPTSGFTGIWVGSDKIAALGIAVKQRVTFHGFALNVNTDLSRFQLINPCGIVDKGVTSIAQLLGRPLPMSAVKHQVCAAFEEVFGIEVRPTSLHRLQGRCPDSGMEPPQRKQEV